MNQLFENNEEYEILTPNGWEDFKGIIKNQNTNKAAKLITFSDDTIIKATNEHRFLSDSKEIKVSNLNVGDKLDSKYGKKEIINIVDIILTDTYEVFNSDNHVIFANDIHSHQCDEFAFVPNNIAEDFFSSTYPVISSGESTKLVISSTPNGMSLFYKLWTDAVTGRNGYKAVRVRWDQVPGRDQKFKEDFIKSTSQRQWSQEMESCDYSTIINIDGKETMIGELYEDLESEELLSVALNKYKRKILTPNGYEEFLGINKISKEHYVHLKFSNGKELKCSDDHPLITVEGIIKAKDIDYNTFIETEDQLGCFVIEKTFINEPIDLYDIVDSGKDHVYYTNGVLSHNCVSGRTLIDIKDPSGKAIQSTIYDLYQLLGPIDEYLYSKNSGYKVKTTLGYEHFSGIKKTLNKKIYTIITENGRVLDCTDNHKLKTPAGWMEVHRLHEGDTLDVIKGQDKIISIIVNVSHEDVYDVINAGEKKSYYTNGILSHNCEFLGSSNTLISGEKLATLTYKEPINKYFNMLIYDEPVKETFDEDTGKQLTTDHLYAITVDVAEGKNLDYSAFSVFDISVVPYKQVATYRNNEIAPILYPTVIKHCAEYYNNAHVLIEINNSPQVAHILQEDLEYENVLKITSGNKKGQTITLGFGRNVTMGLKMTPLAKRTGCSSLKTLIENDKLIIQDFDTYSELTTFIQTGPSFAAEEGCNDDMAMTIVIFAWLATQKLFKEIVDHDIRKQLQLEHFEFAEEDQLPTGEYNLGLETEMYVEDGAVWIQTNSRDPYGGLIHELFDF